MWLNWTYFKRLIIFIVIIKSSVHYVYSCDIACEAVMYGLAKNCWKQETNLQLFINFQNLLHRTDLPWSVSPVESQLMA